MDMSRPNHRSVPPIPVARSFTSSNLPASSPFSAIRSISTHGRFEDQPEFDEVDDRVRVIRIPCGGNDFIPKEYLYKHLMEWCENAVRFIRKNNFTYTLINSHYWDAGIAGQRLSEALAVTHIHTPHSLGMWKKSQMETDYPDKAAEFDKEFNFSERIKHELIIYRSCSMVIATTPIQVEMLVNDYNLPRDRVHMIPPGYDDNRFFPVSRATREMARQRFGFEGKVVMAMGRLATNKGYDLLIDGFFGSGRARAGSAAASGSRRRKHGPAGSGHSRRAETAR